MNTAYLIVAAVPAPAGTPWGPYWRRSFPVVIVRSVSRIGGDLITDGNAQEIGSHMKPQTQLNEHRTGVEMLNDGLPAAGSRATAICRVDHPADRHVDQSGGSTVEDDYLITEVMQLRA